MRALIISVAILAALGAALLGGPTLGQAGDCDTNWPCYHVGNNNFAILGILNTGQGAAIVGETDSDATYGDEIAGVAGWSSGYAPGLRGKSLKGKGLHATGMGDGVVGECQDYNGVAPTAAGVYGYHVSKGPGVRGLSDHGVGVYGQGSPNGTHGVLGECHNRLNLGYAGVYGVNYYSGPGLKGYSGGGPGVYGEGGTYGVHGMSRKFDFQGILGENVGNGWAIRASGNKLGLVAWGPTVAIEAHSTEGVGVSADGKVMGVRATSEGTGVYSVAKTGNAGLLEITNATSVADALKVQNKGMGRGAYFQITNAANGAAALRADTAGQGSAGLFVINNATNANPALKSQTNGTGWAGWFQATGLASRGVYIKTNGGTALQVSGGTKSAVVPTSKGARALYAEEASEVYFTDYGFGKLKNGKAAIKIDPLFAETVNVKEPYHVFLQARGNADLYVGKCTPKGFEVCLRGGESDVEFSYRLVAKRQGFEQARLEHAPWADNDPNLYPEKPLEKVAAAH